MSNNHNEEVATAKFKEDTNGGAKAYPQRKSSASLRDSDARGPLLAHSTCHIKAASKKRSPKIKTNNRGFPAM